MGYFKNICLLKAPQYFDNPFPQFLSDITEVCYLASMVEKEVDTVSIPPDYFNTSVFESFTAFLKNNPVDLAGISSMTGGFNNALKLAEIAKKYDKYVVVGGYHPSALPEEVLKSPFIDSVIIGEGEATLKELVIKGPGKDVAGMAYKDKGGIVFNEPRPLINNLDSIPHPLRRARPTRYGEKGDNYSIDTVYTSRGCPWSCAFCANHLVHNRWRARSPENVLEELRMLHDPKRRKFIKIWDANFLTNVKRVEKICDLMIEENLTNFKIAIETRIGDVIRAEGIMDKLRKVGLRKVGLGIESPNVKTLELMKKKNDLDELNIAVQILRKHRLKSQGYFIIGHYNETVEDTKMSAEFARSLGLGQIVFFVMTPYPGTHIFEEYKDENRIKSFDWDLYNNFSPVVETRGMDNQTLRKMLAYCYGRIKSYSALKNSGLVNMVLYLIDASIQLYIVIRMHKTITDNEVKDLIFEFFRASLGKKDSHGSKKPPKNIIPFLASLRNITIRIMHSPNRNIDFIIMQDRDVRYISVEETDDTGPVNGPVIALDEVIKFIKVLFSDSHFIDRFASVLARREIARGNPYEKLKGIILLTSDRNILVPILNFYTLAVSTASKGIPSALFTHIKESLKKKKV